MCEKTVTVVNEVYNGESTYLMYQIMVRELVLYQERSVQQSGSSDEVDERVVSLVPVNQETMWGAFQIHPEYVKRMLADKKVGITKTPKASEFNSEIRVPNEVKLTPSEWLEVIIASKTVVDWSAQQFEFANVQLASMNFEKTGESYGALGLHSYEIVETLNAERE